MNIFKTSSELEEHQSRVHFQRVNSFIVVKVHYFRIRITKKHACFKEEVKRRTRWEKRERKEGGKGRGKKERKTENPQETRPVLKIHMQSQAWKYVRQRRGQRRSPLEFLHVQPRGPGVGKSSSMASRWTSIDPRPHTSTFSWTRRRNNLFRGTESSTGFWGACIIWFVQDLWKSFISYKKIIFYSPLG